MPHTFPAEEEGEESEERICGFFCMISCISCSFAGSKGRPFVPAARSLVNLGEGSFGCWSWRLGLVSWWSHHWDYWDFPRRNWRIMARFNMLMAPRSSTDHVTVVGRSELCECTQHKASDARSFAWSNSLSCGRMWRWPLLAAAPHYFASMIFVQA